MIDYLRITLYILLAMIGFLLYQSWDREHAPVQSTASQTTTVSAAANNYVPEIATTTKAVSSTATAPEATARSASSHIIHVATNVLEVDIDALGGNIVQVKLPKFPQQLNSTAPFLLLNDSPENRYIAQSGLLSSVGPDTSKGQALYNSEVSGYTATDGQKEIQVKLAWHNKEGLKVTKIFIFKKDSYEIGVAYKVDNQSKKPWEGNFYAQLMRKDTPPADSQGFVNLATYFGAAVSSPEKPFQKITFKDMANKPFNQSITGGWAAMIQHYFISAWAPEQNTTSQYFTRVTKDGLHTIGMLGPTVTASPGATVETKAKFYAGPTDATELEKVAPGLQLTIDYGWFWFISVAIFWMMKQIYSVVGNWGWSIVLVTLIIKLMFYQLSAKSYRSMSALKNLQPRINSLKERYGEDKQKFTQATLELYKKEKVNPMSGCLPILIQIPVFIGLYWVLIENVELRQAPFILWIHDLTAKDPYYILPIVMGISMFLQQRLSPPPPDPMQAKIMMAMPIVFTILFINFPAGLMLYWVVNNVLSFLQQWYIMHSMEKAQAKKV